jgi:hypothetical protein
MESRKGRRIILGKIELKVKESCKKEGKERKRKYKK